MKEGHNSSILINDLDVPNKSQPIGTLYSISVKTLGSPEAQSDFTTDTSSEDEEHSGRTSLCKMTPLY
jgi:hypothetical protein